MNKINEYINILKNKNDYIKKKYKNYINNDIIYVNNFNINFYIYEIIKKFNKNKNIIYDNIYIKTAGRIIFKRDFGKLIFIKIYDLNNYIQIYISYLEIKLDIVKDINIGDIILVEGLLFITKTNELSIKCKKIFILVKSLKKFPDKFHKISNNEIIYKKRYLDIILNTKSKEIFIKRFNLIKEIRLFLFKKDFIEVETPIIQKIPGGADAKPFITKINNSNKEMFLRISPELYLKKLIVGGFNKIFEINKNFRNEGVSNIHNPEFTMIEIYIAYIKYNILFNLIYKLFKHISKKILNSNIIKYKNIQIDFSKPFAKISMKKSIYIFNKQHINNIRDLNSYKKCISLIKKNNIEININNTLTIEEIHYELFKKTVEKNIINPTFIYNFPVNASPLSRRNDKNNNIVDRFELFINGMEICNGFSELNDPYDQSMRFYNQIINNNKNNINYDYSYIEALEYGLPPCSGLGIGIDRLVMLFTNCDNIKDVILFPNMHNK